jgi:hypothetical protein
VRTALEDFFNLLVAMLRQVQTRLREFGTESESECEQGPNPLV